MFYPRVEFVQSELEERFLEDCVTIGLIVDPQYTIGKIHADFAIPEFNLAIEIDSKQFHSGLEALRNDELRDRYYNKRGWGVLRIKGAAVMKRGEEIAQEIKDGKYYHRSVSIIFN